MQIDTSNFEPQDLVIVFPLSLVGDGEPGDPFPAEFAQHLRSLAGIGYGPIDWTGDDAGSEPATHLALWFAMMARTQAIRTAETFIERGGYV